MQDKQTKKAKEPTISFVATQKALEQYLGISK